MLIMNCRMLRQHFQYQRKFYKCKSLKLMDIKSKKLKKAGVKVIDKTSQKFKIKAPDGKYNKYAKIFKINV